MLLLPICGSATTLSTDMCLMEYWEEVLLILILTKDNLSLIRPSTRHSQLPIAIIAVPSVAYTDNL